jgi:DNA polymerase III subunit beta
MKVLCDREKLREALAVVNSVIPTKSSKPVLENVCLVATDNALELLGSDYEISLRYRITDVQVSEPGPAVLPARVTLDFIRDLTGETVTLETNGRTCVITSGADSCELVTVDPDEFPVIAHLPEKGAVSMQGGTFARLVGQTAFAAAREAGRYAMHGILTEVENSVLRMVATDGRRLALASAPVDVRQPSERPAIVPTKGMQLFCRVIHDPLDQVELHFLENQIGLRTSSAEIFTRLIDGEFPRYSAVIPLQTANVLEADADLLARKLRLVANVTGDDARAVRLNLSKDQLDISGKSVGRGEAHAHLEVVYKGGAAEIAFNPDYVLDGLKHCEGDTVRLEFEQKTTPGKFTLGENYIYIVMPITVDA